MTATTGRAAGTEPMLLVERRGPVALLTLNRPAHRNTVTYEVIEALIAAVDEIEADDSVRAAVLTASGRFFSAGTDLSSQDGFAAHGSDFKPLRGGDRDIGGELSLRLFDSTVPFVAAYNGTAVGIGVTMTLPMDVRIAADTARFGLPFTRRGIVPESCATWFLPRLVGIGRAVEWAVTAGSSPPPKRRRPASCTRSCRRPRCSSGRSPWPKASPRARRRWRLRWHGS